MTVPTIPLGQNGPHVSRVSLGCMGMSGAYGPSADDDGIKAIHAAVERGVNLLDTGDFYGMGHNEMLVGKAIAGRRDRVVLSVKFGGLREPNGGWLGFDARPAAVKNFAAYSLKRLGVDVIDVYRPARLDPNVPIEDTVGAIADLVKQGYVKHVGLSEVSGATVERALKVHPICDVQIEYSLASRRPEENLFPTLKKHGVSATLYGVLSRGLLSGSTGRGPGDFRAHAPRFQGENLEKNKRLVDQLAAMANERNVTPAQLALGYVLAKEPGFVALVGARTPRQIIDAVDAQPLSNEDVAAIDALGSFAGERYDARGMSSLDSER
jgi:aryl-alcohol dehydrogenase-like predicted oxidoreductase